MANLKRNLIELVKNPEGIKKGDEPEIEKVWTPAFLTLRVSRDAVELYNSLQEDDGTSQADKFDRMVDFVANEVYDGKITKDDIYDRMHGPGGKENLEGQIIFAAQGQQTNSTKNFLAKKN